MNSDKGQLRRRDAGTDRFRVSQREQNQGSPLHLKARRLPASSLPPPTGTRFARQVELYCGIGRARGRPDVKMVANEIPFR